MLRGFYTSVYSCDIYPVFTGRDHWSGVWTVGQGSGPLNTGLDPCTRVGYMPERIQRPGPVLVDTSSQSAIRSRSVYRIAVYGPALQHTTQTGDGVYEVGHVTSLWGLSVQCSEV